MDLRSLLRQAVPKSYGPRPAFSDVDLVRCLWLLSRGRMGRQRVSELLGVGEGSVRSLLSILERERLVVIRKPGCRLTASGASMAQSLGRRVPFSGTVSPSPLTFNLPAFLLVVRHAADGVSKGLEERDAAIREGAMGATVLVCKNGRLLFPGTREAAQAEAAGSLMASCGAKDGDLLLLCYAPSTVSAERGAWAAALRLL